MRDAFITTLFALAAENSKIHLIVGDLGYSVIENFAKHYPKRFLNVGVAEQNMTGIAAGMAMIDDRCIFTYSIANFPTIRCLEQVRNDVCYHRANVKIVALGGGVAYGSQGYTHHALEDIAVMRSLPSMVVAVPADPLQTSVIVRLAAASHGPWYIRLGRNQEPSIHTQNLDNLQLGDILLLRDGTQGTLVATGAIAYQGLLAVDQLAKEGISLRFLVLPFLKPLQMASLYEVLQGSPFILSLEEHNAFGGLGSVVAEVLAEAGSGISLIRLCYPDQIEQLGSQEYIRCFYGLDAEGLIQRIRRYIVRLT
jgi:transketolase